MGLRPRKPDDSQLVCHGRPGFSGPIRLGLAEAPVDGRLSFALGLTISIGVCAPSQGI